MWQDKSVMSDFLSEFNLVSELGHFFTYSIRKPKMSLEKGMIIISIDVDVGSSKLGIVNKGKRDRDVNIRFSEYQIGKIEELAVPMFVETLDDFGIPITFAVRGQLTEVDGQVLELLLASGVRHDIGAHGYYHRKFTRLANDEAEEELSMISAGMKEYGLVPRTFVFPVNCVAHLDLLEKYNYLSFRGYGDYLKDCMYIEKCGGLYNVHPSIYFDQHTNLQLLKKILDISIKNRSPFHLWFHSWNFGEDEKSVSRSIKNVFVPFLQYAKDKQENGILTFDTMLSATQKVESS
jgi:peptidoglycan/xylan/chitin deacetylase (PgdA/CDA1 family)